MPGRKHIVRTKSKPLICLRDASFRLGDFEVFQNTTWAFHRGEQWGVLGPNGAGKTLFADCLRGNLPLVSGELSYNLRPPAGLSPEETIGHVSFEDRAHDLAGFLVQSRWNSLEEENSMRVTDFLSYEQVMEVNPFEVTDLHARRKPAFERRRNRAVRLLGISNLLSHSVISLSNGERQKVQLARALCHSLRLLILDDPFAGLDADAREAFHASLNRLAKAGFPCMVMTTREEDLPKMVNRVMLLKACRITALGARKLILGSKAGSFRTRAAPGRGRKSPIRTAARIERSRDARELVRLRNVTVRYGPDIVLENFSWIITEGENWALLGANGSGKTTLLSLIQGDHPQAYSNDVRVLGRSLGAGHSVWSIKRRIGVVSPELHACFDMDQTALAAVCSGFYDTPAVYEAVSPSRVRTAQRLLRGFGIGSVASESMAGLSAGTQRLVLLARALVKRPPLLLLDEPCQGLDAEHRTRFVTIIDHLIRRGTATVIYVTHRRDEIPASIRKTMLLT